MPNKVFIKSYVITVHVPDGLNLVNVAACIGDCIRAYIALFYSSKVTRDDTVLVLRGALPCADICIQIAHRVGCKVLTTCTSTSEKTYLEKLGNCTGVYVLFVEYFLIIVCCIFNK